MVKEEESFRTSNHSNDTTSGYRCIKTRISSGNEIGISNEKKKKQEAVEPKENFKTKTNNLM